MTVEVPQPEVPAEPQVDGAQHIITAPSAPDPVPEADVNDIQVTATTGLTATPTPTPTSSVALKDHVEIPKAHVEETKLPTSFLLLLGGRSNYAHSLHNLTSLCSRSCSVQCAIPIETF